MSALIGAMLHDQARSAEASSTLRHQTSIPHPGKRTRRSRWGVLTRTEMAEVAGYGASNQVEKWNRRTPSAAEGSARFEALLGLDLAAMALRAAGDRLAEPITRVARIFVSREAWKMFGYARLEDHARERFRRSGRWVRDLASLGESLEAFPCLAAALTGADRGEPIGRVAALAIGRVKNPQLIRDLIAVARRVPVRQLRETIKQLREAEPCADGEVDDRADQSDSKEQSEGGSPSRQTDLKARTDHEDASRTDSSRKGVNQWNGGTGAQNCDESSWAWSGSLAAAEDSEEPRSLVSFVAPPAMKAAFDEALLLHRAVCGREEPVASFVDALAAESFTGPHPPDAVEIAVCPGESLAISEATMAHATSNWRALASQSISYQGHFEDGLASVGATLSGLEALSAGAGTGNAIDLDEQMRALLDLEDRIDRELGLILAEMSARGAWARLLFSGAGHYAEERLRLGRTTAEGRAQMARALRSHSVLRRAYENGSIGMEAALIVLRILGRREVDEQVEQAWVDRATEATIRRLRDEARALGFRKVIEGSKGHASDGRPHIAVAASQVPLPQTDAEWYASLRRRPGDFRKRVELLGRIAAASPVADVMRLRLPEDTASSLLSAMESASRRLEAQVASLPREEPWPDADAPGSVLSARTFSMRGRRVPSWVGLLALLEDYVRTWDASSGIAWDDKGSALLSTIDECGPARGITGEIPNAPTRKGDKSSRIRRAAPKRKGDRTYSRDGWRCAAPGCTSRTNLEVHHVVYRSRGGGNETSNLVCVCRFHHQIGEHGGLASCRGRAPLGIVWSLGAGGIGGRYGNDRIVRDP